MNAHSIGGRRAAATRTLVIGTFLCAILLLTPSRAAADCYYEVSVWEEVSYFHNGDTYLVSIAGGVDYSWCDGGSCSMTYYMWLAIDRIPDQEVISRISSGGTSIGGDTVVTPGQFLVAATFAVYNNCHWPPEEPPIQETQEEIITVPPPPPPPPSEFRLTINAFIPYDWLDDPFGSDSVGAGDRPGYLFPTRSLDFSEDASNRVSQIAHLIRWYSNPEAEIFSGSPATWSNYSVLYQKSTSLDGSMFITDTARNDWDWGEPLKTQWAHAEPQGSCSGGVISGGGRHIHCEVEAVNGIYTWLPAIAWNLDIDLQMASANAVQYGIHGCHKYFPAYAVWIAGQPVYTRVDSGSVYDIWWPCGSADIVETSGSVMLN